MLKSKRYSLVSNGHHCTLSSSCRHEICPPQTSKKPEDFPAEHHEKVTCIQMSSCDWIKCLQLSWQKTISLLSIYSRLQSGLCNVSPHSMWVHVVEALLINLHSCWMYNQDAMRPIRLLFRRVLNSRPRIRHWCDMRTRAERSILSKTDEDEEKRFKQLSRQDPSFGWR